MASGDAWQAGWNLGSNLAGQRYAQKQGRANELWEDRRDQLKANITNLASKYASQLGPNGQPTPASLQTKYILEQAELNKDLFENPIKGPGAMERLGWLLHLSSRPQAHTGTFQTGGEPIPGVQIAAPNNPPAAGDLRFAVPAGEPPNPVLLKRTGTETAAQPAQGLPSATSQAAAAPPTMPSGAPTSAATTATAPDTTTQAQTSPPTAAPTPTRPVQTVAMKVPGLTRRQIQQQAQARLRAQQETEMLTAAAPPSGEQQAIQQAHAQTAGLLTGLKDTLDAVDQFFPPEDRQRARQDVLEKNFGIASADVGKWDRVPGKMNGQPTTLLYNEKTGQYRTQTGETVDSELLKTFVADPKASTAKPSTSAFNEALAAYARSHGMAVEDLPPEAYDYETRKLALDRAMPSSTTTTTLRQNQAGQWVPVTETNYRTPGGNVRLVDPLGSVKTPPSTGAAPQAPSAAAPAPASPAAVRKTAQARAARPQTPSAAPKGGAGNVRVGAPLFQGRTPEGALALKNVDIAQNSLLDVKKASADPTPVGDQGVILAWLRGRVNRVTATEIAAVNNLGGAQLKLEGNLVRIATGKMTDHQRAWFLQSAQNNYDNAVQIASKYTNPPAPATGGSQYKQTATGPNNQKIGSNDGGNTWYDVTTGKLVP